jgi:hypothetical protein
MIDLPLCQAIRETLSPSFPGLFIGVPHEPESITIPACLLNLVGDAVVGGPLVRGVLEVTVMTSSNEYTSSQHAQLVRDVAEAVRDVVVDSEDVQLYGVVPSTTRSETQGNHFETVLTFVIGYGPRES